MSGILLLASVVMFALWRTERSARMDAEEIAGDYNEERNAAMGKVYRLEQAIQRHRDAIHAAGSLVRPADRELWAVIGKEAAPMLTLVREEDASQP